MIQFFLPCRPPETTHHAKQLTIRNGKPVMFDSPEVKAVRQKFKQLLHPHRLEQPLEGPLRIRVMWMFPKIPGVADNQYKHTKPDLDNLHKALMDEMEDAGFFRNDSQLASVIMEKFWSEPTGIYIELDSIGGTE